MARICPKCGKQINGLLEEAEHPCNGETVEFRTFKNDGEFREAMIEIGLPKMAFDAFQFTPPTEMERKIYEITKEEEKEKCQSCGVCDADEPHTCHLAEEVHGDKSLCNCCFSCAMQCHNSV